MTAMTLQPHYRTVWISDVHLGTRGCQADLLLDFLNEVTADTYYLVGDIIDGWRLKKSWHWPESHHAVITTIMDKAKNGAKVIFIPGNHDEFAREFVEMTFAHVEVKMNDIHETADGKRLLVIHGDEFDGVVKYAKWLAYLGDTAYNLAITLNRYYNGIRRRLGYGYWSLSAYLKNRSKTRFSSSVILKMPSPTKPPNARWMALFAATSTMRKAHDWRCALLQRW